MQFWTGWKIWQQLCFVLGGCICLVFILGFSMRLRNGIKVKRLLRTAAESAERGEIVRGKPDDEVPFGVRAIEAGCEVEGIWNSKTTTPLQSPTPSLSGPPTPVLKPRKLFKSKRSLSPASTLRLEVPEPANVRQMSTDYAGQSSNQAIPSHETSQAKRNTITLQSAARPTARRSHTVIIGGRCDQEKFADDNTSHKSIDTIKRMQEHRERQTAETGQLFPRTRRGASEEIRPVLMPSVSDYGAESQRPTSWSNDTLDASGGEGPLGFALKPEVAQFNALAETNPHPIKSNKTPPSAWTDKTTELVEEKLQKTRPSTLLTPDSLSHLNENTRKVNDGFEVLPAGTFDLPTPVKEFGLWPETLKTEEKRKPKKLQKRNRSPSGSKGSSISSVGVLSETENVYHSSTD